MENPKNRKSFEKEFAREFVNINNHGINAPNFHSHYVIFPLRHIPITSYSHYVIFPLRNNSIT